MDGQDSNFHPLQDHQQQPCVVEVCVPGTAADRENSSLLFVLLAFVVAVSWHAEEYTYAVLSALALVSAFLDTGALMCLDRHENTTGFTTGLLFSTFRLCRLSYGRVRLFYHLLS